MKVILDVDHIVRVLNLSPEAFAKWKAANLDQTQDDGGIRWPEMESNRQTERSYHSA